MDHNQPPPLALPPQPRNSALAIWSLVLGILSLTCFWLLTAIPAVICGHVADSKIRRSEGMLQGRGLALAGMITGYISIALSVFIVPLLIAIAVPNFIKARSVAQTNACINNLRLIEGAKQTWALQHKKSGADTPTERDLAPYLPQGWPTCPAGGIYSANSVEEKPTCSIFEHRLAE